MKINRFLISYEMYENSLRLPMLYLDKKPSDQFISNLFNYPIIRILYNGKN